MSGVGRLWEIRRGGGITSQKRRKRGRCLFAEGIVVAEQLGVRPNNVLSAAAKAVSVSEARLEDRPGRR